MNICCKVKLDLILKDTVPFKAAENNVVPQLLPFQRTFLTLAPLDSSLSTLGGQFPTILGGG